MSFKQLFPENFTSDEAIVVVRRNVWKLSEKCTQFQSSECEMVSFNRQPHIKYFFSVIASN